MNETDVTPEDIIKKLGLEKPKRNWNKYIPHILCIIFFAIAVYNCNGSSGGELDKKTIELALLKSQYNIKEKKLLAENDSLNIENSNLEDENSFLEEQHSKDSLSLLDNNKKRDVIKRKIEKYSNNEYASWFGNRYHEVESVTSTPNGIELKNQIPLMVAVELNNYDFAREELRIKDKTISDYIPSKVKDVYNNPKVQAVSNVGKKAIKNTTKPSESLIKNAVVQPEDKHVFYKDPATGFITIRKSKAK